MFQNTVKMSPKKVWKKRGANMCIITTLALRVWLACIIILLFFFNLREKNDMKRGE